MQNTETQPSRGQAPREVAPRSGGNGERSAAGHDAPGVAATPAAGPAPVQLAAATAGNAPPPASPPAAAAPGAA
ncbi:MAG: hypothetical protein ACFCUO_00030, partial [Rhodospirillales bacterium]